MSTNREADILEAMQYASLDESRRLVAELDQIRAEAATEAQADRDWDAANAIIEDHLTPVLVHGMHSTATDWLDEQVPDYGTSDLGSIANAMRTEASVWYSSLHPAVKANKDELREQARGIARRLGSQYGAVAGQASDTFMEYVGRLVVAEGTDMGNIPSAAGDSSNPLLTAWDEQPVVDGASHSEGSPPPAPDAPDASPEGGIPAAPAAPAPASSSAGEPTDTAPSAENHSRPEDTHNNPGNAADTAAPVTARYETAQQRAIRQYFATEEGSEFPVPGEQDPDQDGEAASSLPLGVDVAGHPDTFPNFIDPVAPKPAPSTRAPNMTGNRRTADETSDVDRKDDSYMQDYEEDADGNLVKKKESRRRTAVSTGPNPQGSFIYDPIKVEAKGYEEGFAYALTWAPGKAIPAALTSSATIGNKYNAEYVTGYKSGFADGVEALSPEYQQAYLTAHKQQVLATRRKASPNTLQFSDENKAEAFPFTWSTTPGGGQGAADVANVPTPGSEVANYPQPSNASQGEAAVGDTSTEIDPIIEEEPGDAHGNPEKLARVRANVRRRLGFNVRADQPDDNDGLRPVVDIYDEALYQGLENGLSMEDAELFAERQVERLASKTADGPRKVTKFQTCDRHSWLDGETRNRRAEFFIEGGPAGSTGCSGGECKLWPGTDLFTADICNGEYPLDWTKPKTASKTAAQNYHCTGCGETLTRGKKEHATSPFCTDGGSHKWEEGKTAGAYGDTSPHQDDWANQLAGIKAQTENCPHCKGAKTRSGDPDAICGPHRDSMRTQYATHPASETYWTSSKTAAQGDDNRHETCRTCGVSMVGDDPDLIDGECPDCADPYSDSKQATRKTAEEFGDQYYDPNGKPCANCGRGMDNLSEFPGDLCISCHANSPEGRYMPTADELTQMWGGPVRASKVAYGDDDWDTGEVKLHFANDYDLYSATRGGWATADDLRELWGTPGQSPNNTVDADLVDWESVAADVNEEE